MQNEALFKFTDYRLFLKTHAEWKRKTNPKWTLGMWARALDLGATTSLTMILNGQREVGPEIYKKLTKYFRFDKKEQQYFQDLILLSKVKDDDRLRVLLLENLQRTNPRRDVSLIDEKTFAAISNWYFYCLRQMTRLSEFSEDPSWIQQRMRHPITEKQIRSAIKTMLELKLLKRNSDGRLEIESQNLKTTEDVDNEGLKRFHEQMIENAKSAVRAVSVHEREIAGLTLPIQKSRIKDVKILIRKFSEEISEVFGNDGGDAVYQLNLQLFPLAEVESKK